MTDDSDSAHRVAAPAFSDDDSTEPDPRALLDLALDDAMRHQRAWFALEPIAGMDRRSENTLAELNRNASILDELSVAWEVAAGLVHGVEDVPSAFGSACAGAARMARVDAAEYRRLAGIVRGNIAAGAS